MVIRLLRYICFLAFLFCLVFPTVLQAQSDPTETEQDTVQNIDVDHADIFEYIQKGDSIIQKLNGNVELRQDSVYMYCDTATIVDEIDVFAHGNVLIQQGDSVSVFSDSLAYDGTLRIADLFGDVILLNGTQRLFTNRLTYDMNTKVATYFEGATLSNDSTQLTSKRGYYYVETKEAYFKDSVVVVDPQFNLRSDTLKFNTETKVVTFLGPTLITSDTSKVYCEAGFYDTENSVAEFTVNAQFKKGEQEAIADTIRYDGTKKEYRLQGDAEFQEGDRRATADLIRYDEAQDITFLTGNATFQDSTQNIVASEIIYDAQNKAYSTRGRSRISDPPQILEADQVDFKESEGLGLAVGNVIWRDTSAALTIVCDRADYQQETDYLKASGGRGGRPLLITEIEEDSLFLTSDTLLSVRTDTVSSDSSRLLIAYYDVRIYKSNLQAICDSLIYNTSDSLFYFYEDPIVWSDTSQFTADTVEMLLSDNKLDRIFLKEKGFIINSPDEKFFNQIKGKNITAFFEEQELRIMEVSGNAESTYYAIGDDGGYIGVNETICSDMVLYFGNNNVEKIKFLAQPQATLHPMQQANHSDLKLDGFRWETKFRPNAMEDLFTEEKSRNLRRNRASEDPPPELLPPIEGTDAEQQIPKPVKNPKTNTNSSNE